MIWANLSWSHVDSSCLTKKQSKSIHLWCFYWIWNFMHPFLMILWAETLIFFQLIWEYTKSYFYNSWFLLNRLQQAVIYVSGETTTVSFSLEAMKRQAHPIIWRSLGLSSLVERYWSRIIEVMKNVVFWNENVVIDSLSSQDNNLHLIFLVICLFEDYWIWAFCWNEFN